LHRTTIRNYSKCHDSGRTFIIELKLELFIITWIHPLTVVWHCSALLVHRSISTYSLRLNENWIIGEEEHYLLLPLTMNLPCHRLLYWLQLVVDGNMKLVYLIQR
jgi:hypothetical protein